MADCEPASGGDASATSSLFELGVRQLAEEDWHGSMSRYALGIWDCASK
jgi:hypothetical protein